jgi:hypothetical protein
MPSEKYLAREHSRVGRAANDFMDRIDNALVIAGAALTFSPKQVALAKASNQERQEAKQHRRGHAEVQPATKAAPVVQAELLYEHRRRPVVVTKRAMAGRNPVVSRVDTGKPRSTRDTDMER